jgi:hypothetical protein
MRPANPVAVFIHFFGALIPEQVDCSAGPYSDRADFATFVAELSPSLEPRALLLSASVPASARHRNWMTVETYDYHGHWGWPPFTPTLKMTPLKRKITLTIRSIT